MVKINGTKKIIGIIFLRYKIEKNKIPNISDKKIIIRIEK